MNDLLRPTCLLALAAGSKRVFPVRRVSGPGRWMTYGIELPDGVLEKIYHKNADRLFAQFKGIH
jgi:hypothetical protein